VLQSGKLLHDLQTQDKDEIFSGDQCSSLLVPGVNDEEKKFYNVDPNSASAVAQMTIKIKKERKKENVIKSK